MVLVKFDGIVTTFDKLNKYSKKLSDLYKGQGNYNIKTNDQRLINYYKPNFIKCYVSQQKGNYKFINKRFINSSIINKWKVITSESYGASKYFGNMFIGKPFEVYTQSYISFEVNNEKEANSLLSYLKCKLPIFMLSIRKISQHISEKTIIWIPLPPLDRIWNNEKIYKFFKLTEKEIKIVEENVKL